MSHSVTISSPRFPIRNPLSRFSAKKDDIRVKTVYNGEVQIIHVSADILMDTLWEEMRKICRFLNSEQFTLKWMDDEGDPCRITSQQELDEAFRLSELEKDREITIHVFPNGPPAPGLPCQGEDRSIYRCGARRWRKLYRVNGHVFQAKRFNRRAFCAYCQDRIWGLGRQGLKCTQCKLLVHKKCQKVLCKPCLNDQQEQEQQPFLKNKRISEGSDSPQLNGCKYDVKNNSKCEESALDSVDCVDGASNRQYHLEDFEMLGVLGRGSYAKVFMVELKQTKRIYAMKVRFYLKMKIAFFFLSQKMCHLEAIFCK